MTSYQVQDLPPSYTPAPSSFGSTQSTDLQQATGAKNIASNESSPDPEQDLEAANSCSYTEGSGRPKNFPPFPKSCPLKPCCYFSIKTEVPRSQQWKIYGLLALLLYLWVMYAVNLVVSIIGYSVIDANDKRPELLSTLTVALIYLVIFIPLSLLCWFLPAYCAYSGRTSRRRTTSVILFFIIMMFQVLSFLVNATGIPNFGSCGFFNGSAFFNASGDNTSPSQQSVVAGAMFLIVGFLWLLGLPVAVLLVIMICIHFVCGDGRFRLKRQSDGLMEEVEN